ncbi:MAG: sigma-70 family RNA polymerase sigma factor [Planctomycetes bacterium]|nr:sigma-70 family RNA polymerase sigma factor [Planctomycetota bacterium]MCB9868240.1 sigma-70 family RNA polymerase sigma factor [Planctomycetota bacterium]MCB9888784.1 sigma-70 family RNA polymerase sigma factor [Planctomycetota bacterium]
MSSPKHDGAFEGSITALFARLREGDEVAREELFRVTHDELHRLARQSMRGEAMGHTLQPTALVHEVYLRLGPRLGEWQDRSHFLRAAARAMRRILVDHARRKRTHKRSAQRLDIDLDALVGRYDERAIDLLQLDSALDQLAERDPGSAELIDLHFFGGQTMADCAQLLGVSERQAYRRWQVARGFLHRALTRGS